MKRTMTILLACAVMVMTAEGDSIDLATAGSLSGNKTANQSYTLGNGKTATLTSSTTKVSSGATLSFDLGEKSTLIINGNFAQINSSTSNPGKAIFTLGAGSSIAASGTLKLDCFSTESGLTLNFGEKSAISAKAVNLSSSNLSITTTVSTSGDFYTGLTQDGTASWDLITTTSGITTTGATFALSEISALESLGLTLNTALLNDASQLEKNSYGLVLADNKLQLMANTPEPATATLSLLALAGLAARRRRH